MSVRSEEAPAAVLVVRVEYDTVPDRTDREDIINALQELNGFGDVKFATLDIKAPLSVDLTEEL